MIVEFLKFRNTFSIDLDQAGRLSLAMLEILSGCKYDFVSKKLVSSISEAVEIAYDEETMVEYATWSGDRDDLDKLFRQELFHTLYTKYPEIKKVVKRYEPSANYWQEASLQDMFFILAAYSFGIENVLKSETLNLDSRKEIEDIKKHFYKKIKFYLNRDKKGIVKKFGDEKIVTFVKEVLNHANEN